MSRSSAQDQAIHDRPIDLLQTLIRFDTTNPPGNEMPCIAYVDGLLRDAGIETHLLAAAPGRPNLIARLKGQGAALPILLYGHVDVVTTEKQVWTHPPFEGRIADGYLWGRGALDMKGGVAMMLAAFLRAKAEGLVPSGDVILAIVVDEEGGGDMGARFLVEEYPQLFKDVRYAIGEVGGASITIGGRRFYPIQIAEKQLCWLKATIRGPGGHGSRPIRGGAMAKLGNLLQELDQSRLPVHITPVARAFIETVDSSQDARDSGTYLRLLDPGQTDEILDLLGPEGRTFDPLLHNTVSPTILRGGEKVNVIPSAIELELDGRLLPGFEPETLLAELAMIVGQDVIFEVHRHDPGPAEPDMGLFDLLATVLKEADPDGVPVPMLLSGVTDGRFFSRLGIQTYGFTPMKTPLNFKSREFVHAADERIPVEAVSFGAEAVYQVLSRFG